MSPRVVPLAAARRSDRFGGKASQLAALAALPGVSVPPGFAIGVDAFREFVERILPRSAWPERLIAGPAAERRGDRLARLRLTLLASELEPRLCDEVRTAWSAIGRTSVAVRSSALHEDTEAASAAGLQRTALGIVTEATLWDAIRLCFSSLYDEAALAYLARLPRRQHIGVALVVQTMVEAERAGVLFTVDPLARGGDAMVIEAAHGLGTAVVDGAVSAETWRVARETGTVLERTAGELTSVARVRDGRVVHEPLGERPAAVLDEASVHALWTVARTIERAAKAPRDIEWAIDAAGVHVLQARPIVGQRGARDDRATWVWSNVNVGEALPGVCTPLTWSVGAAFSDRGFRQAFSSLGCHVPRESELVGRFHGRIYLNLSQFMRIARQVPGLDPRVLLEFGGGGGLELLEHQVDPSSWPGYLARAPLAAARLVRENALLDRHLDEFERDFPVERTRYARSQLGACTDVQLADALAQCGALLDRTGLLMLTCASNSLVSVVALRTVLRTAVPRDADRLERELVGGVFDLESAAPGLAIMHIASLARGEPGVRAVLRDASVVRIADLPAGATRSALERFVDAHGFRAVREAELATARWREDPAPVLAMLRAHLDADTASATSRIESQSGLRARAEESLLASVAAPFRPVLRHVVARTRRFTRLRERMRARVTEVLGFHRAIALEASRRMAARDPSLGEGAAFFFELDELRAWLRAEPVDVAPLVTARRAAFHRDLGRPDPPAVFVGTPPPAVSAPASVGGHFRGVAASPGCVEGTVRRLRDPAEGGQLRAGEVLVVPVADVGWTPLFLVAAAVVTELGGALSHAALVAREYGVPTVVNVRGAMRALADGTRVRVDGDRGTVDVVEA